MESKTFLVARKEYIKVVRKPSFWLATLLFPAFMLVVSFVSGYSAKTMEEKARLDLEEIDRVLILDKSGLINPALLAGAPYTTTDNFDQSLSEVLNEEADALFVFPQDLAVERSINIYKIDKGIVLRGQFNDLAQQLVKQSILLEIKDPEKIQLVNAQFSVQATNYKDGVPVSTRVEDFLIPGISVIVYFLLTMLAANFLLMSISEEKESRMIEIILSIMSSRNLIWGKIFGLTGVALTQLVVLVTLGTVITISTIDQLPFELDLSTIIIDPIQVGANLFYVLSGFIMMAAIMVGIGAAMPTYKDAQGLTPVFIIGSIFPVYFATVIIQEPSGLVAKITSYFPLTAPLVLLARNALGELPVWEVALSAVALIVYIMIAFYISFKLFEIGSLEYSRKLRIWGLWKRKRN